MLFIYCVRHYLYFMLNKLVARQGGQKMWHCSPVIEHFFLCGFSRPCDNLISFFYIASLNAVSISRQEKLDVFLVTRKRKALVCTIFWHALVSKLIRSSLLSRLFATYVLEYFNHI